ncbi:MAG: hypothetical protein ABEN55_12005 [Bradymonadaceae bacterium]
MFKLLWTRLIRPMLSPVTSRLCAIIGHTPDPQTARVLNSWSKWVTYECLLCGDEWSTLVAVTANLESDRTYTVAADVPGSP